MKRKRQSNIEAARLLSMFFVLIIHANMISLARPSVEDLQISTIPTIFRYLFESVGIIGVNVFVLISGWFRVNITTQKVYSLMFCTIFLMSFSLLFSFCVERHPISVNNILDCFVLTHNEWFIKAYLVLLIMAPILNIYVDNSSESLQRHVLVWFYLFSSTYGFAGASQFFLEGYSPLSFVGLYLIAQYVHVTSKKGETPVFIQKLLCFNKYVDFGICLFFIFSNTIIGLWTLRLGFPIYNKVYAYCNPLVIISSLYFLLFFSKCEIGYSRLINVLAASSFAVYLLHTSQFIYFTRGVQCLYQTFQGWLCVCIIIIYLVLVYLVSVMIDQIRILLWRLICNR